ncbi:MAG: hypothetical protein EBS47_07030 [Betaproteobacteria bacterium]|nr:hypothetical protein [Betaproteobacteria bacterium]
MMIQRVQRELAHLVIGKVFTVMLGLLVLLLMWRRVAPSAYGQYLSLLASAEILSLISAIGLSTVAQRHLPIWMAHAPSAAHALWRIGQVLLLRIVLASLFMAALIWLATSWKGVWTDFALSVSLPSAVALILTTVLWRSLEEVQVVLLMQAWIQGLAVTAHAVRLMALLTLEAGPAADLQWLIHLELTIVGFSLIVGLLATAHRTLGASPVEESLRNERPSTWLGAWRNAIQFWLIQCLGLTWSIHALRLMLHAVAGPLAVAVHGVAYSMVESLRQATPLMWMTGWLRAAMLRLHASQPDSKLSLDLASAVHRLSLFMLWPVVCAWCVEPVAWFRWVGGAEMFVKAQDLSLQHPWAPTVTGILAATALLAPLQNRHLMISLWAYVQQRPGWGVAASMAAVLCVACWAWIWPVMGLWSVPLVMLMAEVVWVSMAGLGWTSPGSRNQGPGPAIAIPLAALTGAGLARLGLDAVDGHQLVLRLILPLFASVAAVALVAWRRTLWTAAERDALGRCAPTVLLALRASGVEKPSR